MNNGRRPNSSLNGPHSNGPTQYPATKSDIINVATMGSMWNSSIMLVTIPDAEGHVNQIEGRRETRGQPFRYSIADIAMSQKGDGGTHPHIIVAGPEPMNGRTR